MAKLYPPYIEGTIPAQIQTLVSPDTYELSLTIPYVMNQTVSLDQCSGAAILLKDIQTNSVVLEIPDAQINQNYITAGISQTVIHGNPCPVVPLNSSYKLQVAYTDLTGQIGYYSTVGIVKITSPAIATIPTLETTSGAETVFNYSYSYVGEYTNDDDPNEKVYSYNFIIYDENNEEYAASGEIIRNASNTDQVDQYTFDKDLDPNKVYFIQYNVRTINDLYVSSPKYKIKQFNILHPDLDATLDVKVNRDEAYIDISLAATRPTVRHTGTYVLSRASAADNFLIWNKLYTFYLYNENPSRHLFRDFTIEDGQRYKYSIQQCNKAENLYSARILSEEVTPYFEDIFLYDGHQQLKIQFNPQVSSFKTNIQESKTETIGGKYPFFFRNGKINYVEFPLAGLISYQQDLANLFINDEELGLDNFSHLKTSNLYDYNYTAERIFKLKVQEWLQNGKPKLFKSPAEGNYLVRLMNVSLSPEDALGRMLHSFSATACEIGDTSYRNLIDNDIINFSPLGKRNREEVLYAGQTMTKPIYKLAFFDNLDGCTITLDGATTVNGVALGSQVIDNLQYNSISATGDANKPICKVYYTEAQATTDFDNITSLTMDIEPPVSRTTSITFVNDNTTSVYSVILIGDGVDFVIGNTRITVHGQYLYNNGDVFQTNRILVPAGGTIIYGKMTTHIERAVIE